MSDVRALRELETWSAGNIFWGLVLLAVLAFALVVLVRRYLDS